MLQKLVSWWSQKRKLFSPTSRLKILFAASEVTPFAKTGGLADVAGSLPVALRQLGHDIRVVMPYYRSVKKGGFAAKRLPARISVPMADRTVQGGILQGKLPCGVPVYYIENDAYYDREELYGTKAGDYTDNAERFLFFSKAVLETADKIGFYPHVFHCNDWQTGLTPLLLAYRRKEGSPFAQSRTVFTIHNIAYQGIFWHLDMPLTNLGWEVFTPRILEFYGKINLLKAGIVAADTINTVSNKYAQEIQTAEFGCKLEGVLQERNKDLFGILNGVDYNEWSPQTDRFIANRFSPANLTGKENCRADLLAHFGMDIARETPVLAMISRLVDQKGLDIVMKAMDSLLEMNVALVVLGVGEQKYHTALRTAQARYPRRIGLHLGFDNILAHKIEAGADIFLMPSRFEPCGLNQIYSMKYGTIPVVHATGGLDDTVTNYDEQSGTGNGFKFEAHHASALLQKIAEALQIFAQEASWKRLMHNAMACDFSWHASAQQYEKLYADSITRRIFA